MNTPEGKNTIAYRLDEGAWVDTDGNLHFSVPDILAHFGVEDTPENRQVMMMQLQDILSKECPHAKIVERETPED